MKRPLLVVTCIYSLGISFNRFFNLPFIIIFIILSLFCTIIFLKNKNRIYLLLSLSIVIFTFGCTYAHLKFLKSTEPFKPYIGKSIYFDAEVISQSDVREKKINYIILIKNIGNGTSRISLNSRVLLSIYNATPESDNFLYGDIIKGNGKISLPSPAKNSGAFDYKRYLSSQDIYVTISTMSGSVAYNRKADLNLFIRFSLALREKIIKIIDASLPSEEAGLLKGIVIGERNGLSDQAQENFNISGLTHIVCVSGANIAYIACACIFLFGFLKVSKSYSSIITILIIILFTYITGCSPSVVRAAIMGIILLIGNVIQRKSDPLISISTASLFLLLYNPFTLYDVGFQLSFGGTIGIVMFYKTLSSFFSRLPKFINEVLSASLAAQLTVNPIIALYFNKLSLIAIISNLIVVPFTGIVTILGFIMSIAGQFSIFLAKLTGGITYFFLVFMLWASEVTAKIPFASVQVITPGLFFIIGYYILLYLLLYHIPAKKPPARFYKVFWISSGLIALIFSITLIIPKPLEIDFLDIGQGDCCFIKTPSSKTILIDGGGTYPGSTISFGPANTLVPFILDNGKTSIDIAILSHPHSDHIQGIIEAADSISFKKLIIGPQFQQNDDLDKLLEICRRKKVEVLQVSKGDSLSIDGAKFDFLYPSTSEKPEDTSDLNSSSLVAKLSYKGIRVLFTGDIPSTSENEILGDNTNVQADILKVAHHGSVYSSSTDFLKAVSPSTCIISVGKNTFGHPSSEVINRIKSVNAYMYRTDHNGGINVRVYNDKYIITPLVN